jgi:hypothetical protein
LNAGVREAARSALRSDPADAIFVGKDRLYDRRFLQMCSHHLVEPVACTSASGWEKGQVENQVGLVRERFFTPRLRFKSCDVFTWAMNWPPS